MMRDLPAEVKVAAGTDGKSLEENVARATIPKNRVLLVLSNPSNTKRLDLAREERAIRQAISLGKARESVAVETLNGATADDVRRALLSNAYHILHFSGHGDLDSLHFTNEIGKKADSPIEAIATIVKQHPSIRCVILNACDSTSAITQSIAEYTIGMDGVVYNEESIEFSKGFYDAIAAGRSIEYAIDEGKVSCESKGLTIPVKVLRREAAR